MRIPPFEVMGARLKNDISGPALSVSDLTFNVGERVLLDGVSLQVEKGHSVAIMGPSGTGKTSFLMCLAGLLQPAHGAIEVGGEDLAIVSPRRRAQIRLRNIGIVYQFGELISELSPRENVALPALLLGTPKRQAYERATSILQKLHVDELADATTAHLSGGERQRVAIARALINEPLLVLADEPTGSLDSDTAREVSDVLFALPKRQRCALVVVTHNREVGRSADSLVHLESGSLTGVAA